MCIRDRSNTGVRGGNNGGAPRQPLDMLLQILIVWNQAPRDVNFVLSQLCSNHPVLLRAALPWPVFTEPPSSVRMYFVQQMRAVESLRVTSRSNFVRKVTSWCSERLIKHKRCNNNYIVDQLLLEFIAYTTHAHKLGKIIDQVFHWWLWNSSTHAGWLFSHCEYNKTTVVICAVKRDDCS